MTTFIKRALISVFDKTGLEKFAGGLHQCGVEIISTGGTAQVLKDAGIRVQTVEQITGFPECFGGRLKTLHPKIMGGILRHRNCQDAQVADQLKIPDIDLVVVNLYPFGLVTLQPDCTLEKAIENIDIGGPSLIRAAAKNHESVTVVVDPRDYPKVLKAIRQDTWITPRLKLRLAVKAFKLTAEYDQTIYRYLNHC